MKYPLHFSAAMLAVFGAMPAIAAHQKATPDRAIYTYADVIDVQPVVRIVRVTTPRQTCWDETVQRAHYSRPPGHRSYTGTILGGILGGVVGNQFGGGRGNDIMTVAGGLLGASVGRDISHRQHHAAPTYYATTERRCETENVVQEQERLDGYQVTYRYQGRDFVTRTATDPGSQIRVRVQVHPAP